MSNLFNYINKSLIGAVIEGYEYSIATGHVDSVTSICYVVDRVEMLMNAYTHPVQVYITIKIDPAYTTYTSIDASNLLLTQVVYIPANLIEEVTEFPETPPLISQEEGLLGANIKGYKYNIGTGVTDSALTTCRVIDRVRINVNNVLTDVYVCVLYTGTTGSDKIYIPIHLLSEVVSFGIIDPGLPSVLRYTAINFVQDATVTTILFKDVTTGNILRAEPINSIQAVANGVDIRIQRTGGEEIFIDALDITTTYIDGVLVSAVLATALAELNTLYVNAGGSAGNLPVFTSSNTINLITGNSINHIFTGTNIVALEVDISTTGTVPLGAVTRPTQEPRRIIGGSTLAIGTYIVYVTAYNYYGQVTQTLTINVSSSFVNTYSAYGGLVATNKRFYVDSAITSQSSSPLFRAANSTGNAADATYAWSAAWYHKSFATHGTWWGSGLGNSFGVGGLRQNRAWAGFDVNVYGDTTKTIVNIDYGQKWSWVKTIYQLTGMNLNDWKHIVVTYNGGDTDSATNPGGAIGVYDCFQVYIDGTNVPRTSNSLGNTGFNGAVNANGFSGFYKPYDLRMMCSVYSPYYHSNKLSIDEIGFYDYTLSSTQANDIYNGGIPQSLNNISGITNPVDYFRMGDGVDPSNPANTDLLNFPVMYNFYTGRFNMDAINMTVADYVSDVP